MTRQEKRQMRIDRYRSLSQNAEKQSESAFNESHKMASVIPFGQPILVGHHSEKGDRAYRNRIGAKMDKAVSLSKKADYYEEKAKAAESNNSIYLEDSDSIERLQEKVDRLAKMQEMMRGANKIVRKKITDFQKVEELQGIGFSEKGALDCLVPNRYNQIGFESWRLTNNNARLKTAMSQLEKAKRLKSTESKEEEINGIRIVQNTEENRLQIFFEDKPSEEVRSELKHNAFRWSPSNMCWQSYLNAWQIGRAKIIIEKL